MHRERIQNSGWLLSLSGADCQRKLSEVLLLFNIFVEVLITLVYVLRLIQLGPYYWCIWLCILHKNINIKICFKLRKKSDEINMVEVNIKKFNVGQGKQNI